MATNICIGCGLTTDVDGKLIVDLCAGGGLKCVPDMSGGGCLDVDLDTLHYATITRAAQQTIPASTGSCNTREDFIQYDTAIDNVGMTFAGSSLLATRAGEYLLAAAQRDSPGVNINSSDGAANGLETVIALDIFVNDDSVAASRTDRMRSQTHILATSRRIHLEVGDRVRGRWSIHRFGGASMAYPLNPGTDSFLQAYQLPTKFVKPTA